LQDKYKGVDGLLQKLLVVSVAGALAGTILLSVAGNKWGLYTFIPIAVANIGFANMFALAFSMVKDHVEEKYPEKSKQGKHPKHDAYKAQAGTLSTIALTACFFMPWIASMLAPDNINGVFVKTMFAASIISAGVLTLALYSLRAKKKELFVSNPFSWHTNAKENDFIYSDILSIYRNDMMEKKIRESRDSESFYSGRFNEDADVVEEQLSQAIGISVDQLRDAITGFVVNHSLSKAARAEAEADRDDVKAKIEDAFKNAGITDRELEYIKQHIHNIEQGKTKKLSSKDHEVANELVRKILSNKK
jgi:hypothetical protein